MANFSDETAFDEFRQALSWRGHAERIRIPYLCITGESDELSPLEFAEQMFRVMSAPRQLVIYQDSRHGIGNVPSATLGPFVPTLVADWMAVRLAGEPMASERWFVDAGGRVNKTAL
jgi:hypothetical protein